MIKNIGEKTESYAIHFSIEGRSMQIYNLSKLKILFSIYLLNSNNEEVTSRKICVLTQINMKTTSELLRRYSKQKLLTRKFTCKSKSSVYSYRLTLEGKA